MATLLVFPGTAFSELIDSDLNGWQYDITDLSYYKFEALYHEVTGEHCPIDLLPGKVSVSTEGTDLSLEGPYFEYPQNYINDQGVEIMVIANSPIQTLSKIFSLKTGDDISGFASF